MLKIINSWVELVKVSKEKACKSHYSITWLHENQTIVFKEERRLSANSNYDQGEVFEYIFVPPSFHKRELVANYKYSNVIKAPDRI
jgi:hypothetical protein